jgi:DNA-binding response OmpR family regulator
MPKRILVIDDEPQIGELIASVARTCGYRVEAEVRPAAFRDSYRTLAPDLVMVDLQIPETDGIELLRFLAEQNCRAPVLIMSGFDARVLESARRLGVARGLRIAGIVPKPIGAARLRRMLMDAMQNA